MYSHTYEPVFVLLSCKELGDKLHCLTENETKVLIGVVRASKWADFFEKCVIFFTSMALSFLVFCVHF